MRRSASFIAALFALSAAACSGQSGTNQQTPRTGETQAGSSADQEKAPREGSAPAGCRDLPSADQLRAWLRQAPNDGGEAGGLFSGKIEWASIVDRSGVVCVTVVSTDDPNSAWPGSQAIAKAKAYTANAYSTDAMPLSTARMYTLAQPGHSLHGVSEPNAFNVDCLVRPQDAGKTNGRMCGGEIAFGGGLALYKNKTRVGGLGISGDTACADHEIAKRVRRLAGLDPDKGQLADDITYSKADGPSPFTHPLCANTWRNGMKVGAEADASGY
jgi:uncharacterized protein GlcG (DUF336 family)